MNTKTLSLILFVLVWILNACSPASVAIPSEELPAPVIASEGYQALQIDTCMWKWGLAHRSRSM